MKKIASLFKRDYRGDRLVFDEVVDGSEWVLAGEGTPTRKLDGTCCMLRRETLYRRYEVKRGKRPPPDFEAASVVDLVTGKQQGWRPVNDGAPEDKYHIEAMQRLAHDAPDGTYELVGPKVQGNPEGYGQHTLVLHGSIILVECCRTFEGIREFLEPGIIEGIVWHHRDGRMVKIKGKDFGFRRIQQ